LCWVDSICAQNINQQVTDKQSKDSNNLNPTIDSINIQSPIIENNYTGTKDFPDVDSISVLQKHMAEIYESEPIKQNHDISISIQQSQVLDKLSASKNKNTNISTESKINKVPDVDSSKMLQINLQNHNTGLSHLKKYDVNLLTTTLNPTQYKATVNNTQIVIQPNYMQNSREINSEKDDNSRVPVSTVLLNFIKNKQM